PTECYTILHSIINDPPPSGIYTLSLHDALPILERRALDALGFFGPRLMGYRLNQPVYVLSYANRRRVEMARAMATGAVLLMLDEDRKSTRLNSSHVKISYAVFCLKKKKKEKYTS